MPKDLKSWCRNLKREFPKIKIKMRLKHTANMSTRAFGRLLPTLRKLRLINIIREEPDFTKAK